MAFTGGGDVIGEAVVEITPEFNTAELQRAVQQMATQFERFARQLNLNPATRQVDALTKATRTAAVSAGEARARFVEMAIGLEVAGRSLTQFVTVPLTRFLRSAVLEASHFNEVVQQTQVILGENADAAVEWAESLSASFGLTNSEALETQNNFALLFNEIGVGMDQSVQIAQDLVTRIGDLASFKDFPIEQVIQRIQSGLVGETEAVRRLGVILDESVIKQKAYEQGIVATGEALSTQQKFLLRAQQILEQTSEAQGDAARTADTFAGQSRELRANLSDLREEVGNAFLPAITSVLTQINNLLAPLTRMGQSFAEMDGPIQEIVLGFVALVGIIGPLATGSGRLLVIFRTISGLNLAERIRNIAAQMAAANVATRALQVGLTGVARAIPFIGAGIAVFSLVSTLINRAKDDTVSLDEAITKLKENILDSPRQAAQDFFGLNAEQLNSVTEELALLNAELFTQNQLKKEAEALGRQPGRLSVDLPGISSQTAQEQALAARDALQRRLNEGIKLFTDLVKSGETALAESLITQVTDVRLKEQLQGILTDGLRAKRQDIILSQRQTAINEALANSTKSVADAAEDNLEVLKNIASELQKRANLAQQEVRANEALANARKNLNEATKDVADAQAEYNRLLAEGTVDLEAVARAEERVTEARQRSVEAAEALAAAQQPADAQDLAEAEDAILSAELGLRDVRRENKKAVDDLNKALQTTNRVQRIALNLQGLNLDQIRTAVGNARASAEALRQKTELTEDDNEVTKTAEELADEAIQRDLEERDATRRLADAKEALLTLKKQGTAEDQRVIQAQKDLAEANRELGIVEEELRQARLPDRALVEGIAAAEERVTEAKERQAEASRGVRDAERERITTIKDINIELAFMSKNEEAITNALIQRFGINEQLAEQQRRLARERARQQASSALNSLSFDNIGALGRGLAKATFLSPLMIDLLTQQLIESPGAPIRALLKRIGVPDSLLAGFKDGGVITRPMVANIGEGYKAEAVVPLTNARNAIAALQKGWGYMAPQLKQALAPALAPTLKSAAKPSFSMSHGNYSRRATPELQTLQAILHKLEDNGPNQTTIEAPITLSAPNSDLAARKVARELRKLQDATRGRPDAKMRRK